MINRSTAPLDIKNTIGRGGDVAGRGGAGGCGAGGSWVNETGAVPWWAETERGIVGSCERVCVQRSQEGPMAGC